LNFQATGSNLPAQPSSRWHAACLTEAGGPLRRGPAQRRCRPTGTALASPTRALDAQHVCGLPARGTTGDSVDKWHTARFIVAREGLQIGRSGPVHGLDMEHGGDWPMARELGRHAGVGEAWRLPAYGVRRRAGDLGKDHGPVADRWV
jgi:hypothetical protein